MKRRMAIWGCAWVGLVANLCKILSLGCWLTNWEWKAVAYFTDRVWFNRGEG